MPVSQLVDDTPFCCTNRRTVGRLNLLTYLTNRAQMQVAGAHALRARKGRIFRYYT